MHVMMRILAMIQCVLLFPEHITREVRDGLVVSIPNTGIIPPLWATAKLVMSRHQQQVGNCVADLGKAHV